MALVERRARLNAQRVPSSGDKNEPPLSWLMGSDGLPEVVPVCVLVHSAALPERS